MTMKLLYDGLMGGSTRKATLSVRSMPISRMINPRASTASSNLLEAINTFATSIYGHRPALYGTKQVQGVGFRASQWPMQSHYHLM